MAIPLMLSMTTFMSLKPSRMILVPILIVAVMMKTALVRKFIDVMIAVVRHVGARFRFAKRLSTRRKVS